MISFIILQYNLYEKTIESIKSIEKFSEIDYKIVVVDNHSSNDAYKIICDKYRMNDNVYVIQTIRNLGFAKGNNFGINFAKEKFKTRYYFVINNDIYLNNNLTFNTIEKWDYLNFDVMGPDIWRLDTQEHQNPLPKVHYNLAWLYTYYVIYKIYEILNILYLDSILHKLAIWALNTINRKKNSQVIINEIQEVSKLHGSALVFSDRFIEKFRSPFNELTFMYLEEDFLALRCLRSKAKVIYFHETQVLHDHGSTVTKITQNNHIKRKYIFKNNSDSFKNLIKYYKSKEI